MKSDIEIAMEAALEPIIAMDGDITPDIVEGVVKTVADNILPPNPEATDEDTTKVTEDEEVKDNPKAEDEEEEKKAEDEDPDEKEKSKPAMDADAIEAAAVARVNALWEARESVKPLVGVVAMDSADAVYSYALKQKGVDITGVHPSAFKAMVHMLNKTASKPVVAMDSAFAEDKLTARFK